jgi:pimeloyl-ACP methyl ester carboxylesterase
VKQLGSDDVLFFDGGAGNCPVALREAHRVVIWPGCLEDVQGFNPAHLIGQSAGGHDALRFALTHPERTKSLILSETGAGLRLSRTKLRGVTVPVLVVAGGDESACPLPAARKLAAYFSNGRVAEIVEAAHSPFLEAPGEWSDVVLHFLNSVARQKGPTL